MIGPSQQKTQRNKIESLKTSQNINFIYKDEESPLWPNYIVENFGQIIWDKLWGLLTCIKSAHVKSGRCVWWAYISNGRTFILEGHNFQLT